MLLALGRSFRGFFMIVAPNNSLPAATGSGKIAYDSGSGTYSLSPGITTDGRKFDVVATDSAANIFTLTAPSSFTGSYFRGVDSSGTVRFKVDSNGGATIVASDGVSPAGYAAYTYNSTTANGGAFTGITARGTPASPTATLSGDLLAIFAGGAHTGSGFVINKAAMRMHAAEGWTTSAQGTDIYFSTTKKTTTTRFDRLRISSEGDVVVNPTGASLSTSASNGFLHLSACAGTPTGTPASFTGAAPVVFDSTNKSLWVHDGSQWVTTRRGNVTTTSSATTVSNKEDFVVVNPNGAGYTVTLPPSSNHKGRNVVLKAIPGISGLITVAVSSGDNLENTLNGTTTINTGGISCVSLFADGAGTWFIVSRQ